MKFLAELLNLEPGYNLFEGVDFDLFESLGELNKIDKKLLKAFKARPEYRSSSDKKTAATPIKPQLGQNSKVEEFSDKTYGTAWARIEDDKDAIGMILSYDGDQVVAITKGSLEQSGGYSRNEKPKYGFIFNPKFFSTILDEKEYEKALGVTEGGYAPGNGRGGRYKSAQAEEFKASKTINGSTTDVIGKLKTIIKIILDAGKKNKVEVKTMIVSRDLERAATGQKRATARKGSIPLPTGNKVAIGDGKYSTYEDIAGNYFKSLKSDLRSRLESFKSSKAKAFDSEDDLMNGLIKEGYFDKLKFMGFTYKYGDDRINFSDMRKGEKRQGYESYIEYRIQEGTPEYKKAQADWEKIRGGLDFGSKAEEKEKEALQAAYYAAREKALPPAAFKVLLDMVGGVITPVGIKIGTDRGYYW